MIVSMTQELYSKHFPTGSVFSQKLKQRGLPKAAYWLGLCSLIIGAFFGILAAQRVKEYKAQNDLESVQFGNGLMIFFFALALLGLFLIIFNIVKSKQKAANPIKWYAKKLGYTESDLKDFEAQAKGSDALLIDPNTKLEKMLTSSPIGILTKDWFLAPVLLAGLDKVNELVAVYEGSDPQLGSGIFYFTKNGIKCMFLCGSADAKAFINAVKNLNPYIFTAPRVTLEFGEIIEVDKKPREAVEAYLRLRQAS